MTDTAAPGSSGPARARFDWDELVRELHALDVAVYSAIADTPTSMLDVPLRRISNAANFSKIWLGTAAVMATVGGRSWRRSAITGVAAIGVTSAVVNLGIKQLADRPRPDRAGEEVPDQRHVSMPTSTSFPSGHSASAFAFASAVGAGQPVLGSVLRFAAATVSYSRVHTGVHYPGDTIIGSLIGAGVGSMVAAIAQRARRRS